MTDFDDDFFEKHIRGKATVGPTYETRIAMERERETPEERAAREEKERLKEEERLARQEEYEAKQAAWWEAKNKEAGFEKIEVYGRGRSQIRVVPQGHGRPAVFIEDSKGLCTRCDSLEEVSLLLESREGLDDLIEALQRVRDVYFSK